VTSQSGGTELCSAFVGAIPLLPVYAGEIQTRLLGFDVRAWSDSGEELDDEIGELVVTQSFPSMPIRFWNDEGGRRYRESYFEMFPGVWRHGDFIRINSRGGCHRPMLVKPMDPVAQRLAIHAADPRRLGPVHAVQNRR
jgi:acetoacetyl-CoA synthetase